MRTILSLLLCASLAACQVASHESHASATKWEKDFNVTWGGTTHTTGADGWDNATDHNASFQVAAQTAGVALGSWIAYLQQHSKDLTDQLANANLTSFQKAQLQQQLSLTQAQLKAANDQALIQAGHFKTP